MRKKILFLILTLVFVLGALACGQQKSESPARVTATPTPEIIEQPVIIYVTATPTERPTWTPRPTNTPRPTRVPTNTPTPRPTLGIFDDSTYFAPSTSLDNKLGDYYKNVFEKGILSTGNTYRLCKKLEAAKNGENITVAFIGGSVTEGAGSSRKTPKGYKAGYAYMTYEYIRDSFGAGDGSNVTYVNAGISGTGSDLGLVRGQEDILSYKPDIIFVEFAVNNGTTGFEKLTYEALIRTFLEADNEPAVILLFSAATYAGATQAYMQTIGADYNLPMVSMKDALAPYLQNKTIVWSDFSADNVHPVTDGHFLYAKVIAGMIKAAWDEGKNGESTGYEIPDFYSVDKSDRFLGFKKLDNTNSGEFVKELGGFGAGKTSFSSTGQSDNHALAAGWIRKANAEGTMKLEVKCKTFVIVVKQVNVKKEQSLDVYVDGMFATKLVTGKDGAWNNPATYLLFQSDKAVDHVIEIVPTSGSESASQTILAMGYTD